MKRFSIVQNGYDVDEVNRFIDIVIRRLEKLDEENKKSLAQIGELQKKLKSQNQQQQQQNSFVKNEDNISKALLVAQEASERMRTVAKEESRLLIENAKRNANSIIHEALVEAAKTENEASLLRKNITVYKNRVKNILKAQLEIAEELDKIEL